MSRLSDFDFELPEERIAQTPLEDRASSKLLHLHPDGSIEHRVFREVVDLLHDGDLLVMNDTRVTARRVFGNRPTGGRVELLLLHYSPVRGDWLAMAKPGRKLKPGSIVELDGGGTAEIVAEAQEGMKHVRVDADLSTVGEVPLPPYIHEKLTDPERYQTVYARVPGSAAAPTAGLHFTPEIFAALASKGVKTATVSLSVSVDTFRPIQVDDLDEHVMHGETCEISPETATIVNKAKGRIIAVGTTTVRTLESFAIGPRKVEVGSKSTSIFIRPGYQFQIIDGMFTNFHMPRTTMLLMLAALVGKENLMRAYSEALERDYRFLSFGDSMLIL